ncbi:MAG: hypothetical protein ACR2PS_07990 [Pseudomonadales bacterium]
MRPDATQSADIRPITGTSARVLSDSGATYLCEMPIAEWLGVRVHPRQRDIKRQAKRPHWQAARLATGALKEALRQVVAAEFQGELYKVDGHTRAYLWSEGELDAPLTVIITVHRTSNYDDLMSLYSAFDTATAAETQNDRVFGAFREAGLVLKSKRLRDGFFVDALNIALRGCTRKDQDKRAVPELDLYRAVATFKQELQLLDSVDPQPEIFYGGVVAAALIALSLDAGDVIFFELLSRRQGNVKEGAKDPVQAVLDHVLSLKHQRSAWVNARQVDLCARTLRALTAWKAGPEEPNKYWLHQQVRAVAFDSLIHQVKKRKGIDAETSL